MHSLPHTWHHPHNAASLVREAKANMAPDKVLETAQTYLQLLNSNNNVSSEKKLKYEYYITNLCTKLEDLKSKVDYEEPEKSSIRRRNSKNITENFASYVIPTYVTEVDSEEDLGYRDSEETVKIEEIYYKTLPWFLLPIPHILYFFVMFGFVYGGAVAFLFVEPSLKEAPFEKLVLNVFDSGSRMGWGQLPPTTPSGRIFMTAYCMIIVAMVNGFIATVGNIMANFYCVHLPVLKAKWRGIQSVKVKDIGQEMPLKAAFSVTVFMVLLGYYLWCYQFDKMGIVDVTYFSVMTMMAAAFGDIRTEPSNHLELVVIMLYYIVGIALWGGIFVLLTSYITDKFVNRCQQFLRWTRRCYLRRKYQKRVQHQS
ncbi:unnamed protein product [Bursaphelenchus okinawaensis]|uniref:Ion_trans_2 domain-containing protein n=1 Tax=Bursaphelenchus okinawaensis TaxID=465554 RepID=A0A811L593_9BILA|nr:unnamed protein product [Bursaphelenchus okinawaensis]CAG9117444.1 unnamed protein product [Bursaphelenchus okinawaensis]